MSVKSIAILLVGCLAMLFLAAGPASAQCTVHYSASALTSSFVGPFSSWLNLNAEGVSERPADIVVNGTGCFTAGSILEVSFNAVMSWPTAANFVAGQGTYWDFADPSGALNLCPANPVTVVQPLGANGYVTKIQFCINSGTLDPGAEFILKNLRFDVTGSTGTNFAQVASGGYLNAYVDTTNPPTALPPFPVGYVLYTATAGIGTVGWGFEDGVCPFLHCPYPNQGGTIGYLLRNATWTMTSNPAWTLDFPFRYVNEGYHTTLNVDDPNYIGPTDLVVDVEDIPTGVTVTLPSDLYICSSEGTAYVHWHATSNTSGSPGKAAIGIYQTVLTSGPASRTLYVTTGMTASTGGCPVTNTIGVVIGNPSGVNADGNQQTDLRVVIGPAYSAFSGDFAGDDNPGGGFAAVVPRYLNNYSASAPTRELIGDVNGNPIQYFFLNPTQTVLLFPYVSNIDGWDVGMEVSNTGNDGTIFGNTGQNGALDFYFFPTGGTPFEYTPTTADGRGLVAGPGGTSILLAGGDFADTLNSLLSSAGHAGSFDGYVIVVAHFNFGHGTSLFFDTTGSNTAVPALILGGHCDYNWGYTYPDPTAQPPNISPLQGPACSSARQGDITKLPERLEN